jgi:hypothetical protein
MISKKETIEYYFFHSKKKCQGSSLLSNSS